MKTSRFGVPVEERYFEDYITGAVYQFGAISVTEEEMIDFGCRSRSK